MVLFTVRTYCGVFHLFKYIRSNWLLVKCLVTPKLRAQARDVVISIVRLGLGLR